MTTHFLVTEDERDQILDLSKIAGWERDEMVEHLAQCGAELVKQKAYALDKIINQGTRMARLTLMLPFKRSNDPGFSPRDQATAALVLELERRLIEMGRLDPRRRSLKRFFPRVEL